MDLFNQSHADQGIRIEFTETTDLNTSMRNATAAGTGPDIFVTQSTDLASYISEGVAADVSRYYDSIAAGYSAVANDAGLRTAEVCGLRIGDVDFMRGVVAPAVQYPAEPLKTETARTAIPRTLANELSAHVARRRPDRTGTPLADELGAQIGSWVIERAMQDARAKLADAVARSDGKDVVTLPDDFRFHDLRHYLASLLIASGADVKVVQARLRHASAKTTLDTYSHLWPDSDESTRTAAEAVLAARADQLRTREVIN